MLVVATPNPDSIAETFIRQHIRLVLPGETAVIYFEGDGESIVDLPALKIRRAQSNSVLRSSLRYLLHGYSGSIEGEEKKRILRFFIENDVKCVLAEFGQTGCALKSVCQKARIPLYVFFHGHDASVGARRMRSRHSYWRMSRYASGLFVPTCFFADKVRQTGVSKTEILVAPYGVEIGDFVPVLDGDKNIIVAVGRMVAKKAPHLTVQAFAKVLKKIPRVRLEMIGDGPLLDSTIALTKKMGIEDKVIFHGAKNHDFVKEKVANAALFVQHSLTAPNGDTESLGVSLLEAMASGVPVVTTRHNGFVETIEDGFTGFLVEERDVDGMASRMVEILDDDALRLKMGQLGRERVLANYESHRQAGLLRSMLKL